jgi:hypothetical protein
VSKSGGERSKEGAYGFIGTEKSGEKGERKPVGAGKK